MTDFQETLSLQKFRETCIPVTEAFQNISNRIKQIELKVGSPPTSVDPNHGTGLG